MRLTMPICLAVAMLAGAPAQAQQPASHAPPGPAPATTAPLGVRHVAPSGETKPPGAAVPAGVDPMQSLLDKSDRLGRQMENSVCRC